VFNIIDFIFKSGIQVASNIVVGSFTGISTPIQNGIIVSGNVGIGTNTVPAGSKLSVIGGNININSDNIESGYGILFSDGSFQDSAANNALANDADVSIVSPTNNQSLHYQTSVNRWENKNVPSTVSVSISGVMSANEILLQYPYPSNVMILSGAPNSYAIANDAATLSSNVTINKNGDPIGSINWLSNTTIGSFTFSSNISFTGGDVLQFVAPGVPDATLANVGITFMGYKI
jgi:hypothetical protein